MWETFWGAVTEISQHLSSWTLVTVTAAAAGASVWVAVLAYKNGKQANQIANAAALRDQWHRDQELQRQQNAERTNVATAMMLAINSIEAFRMRKSVTYVDGMSMVEARIVSLVGEATARIDVYTAATNEVELRTWFIDLVQEIDPDYFLLDEGREKEYSHIHEVMRKARFGISEWSARRMSVADLLASS